MFVTGTAFSVIAFLGSVILVGIVVKNAIVLVDFTNIISARGVELSEAIIYSGRNRLRPVLMTTFTTLLGLIPLAISTGDGSEVWRPLGISTIGGLFFSILITLVLVPFLYQRGRRGKGEIQEQARKLRFQPGKFQNLLQVKPLRTLSNLM